MAEDELSIGDHPWRALAGQRLQDSDGPLCWRVCRHCPSTAAMDDREAATGPHLRHAPSSPSCHSLRLHSYPRVPPAPFLLGSLEGFAESGRQLRLPSSSSHTSTPGAASMEAAPAAWEDTWGRSAMDWAGEGG